MLFERKRTILILEDLEVTVGGIRCDYKPVKQGQIVELSHFTFKKGILGVVKSVNKNSKGTYDVVIDNIEILVS